MGRSRGLSPDSPWELFGPLWAAPGPRQAAHLPLPTDEMNSSFLKFSYTTLGGPREDAAAAAAVDPIKEGSAGSGSGSGSTLSLELADSKSCTSSKASGASPEDFRAQQLRIIAVAARFHEFKLQVARRARSKIIKSSDNWKSNAGKMVPTSSSEFESTKAASGITSSSSEGSSAKNLGVQKFKKKREENRCEVLSRKRAGSTHMRRQADAILTFLSGGCASEVKIRQVLGDSPDTSKALRMLLKLDEVKRSGTGGRHDPYIYEVTQRE
ncbi:uncharacterized protein LOC104414613 [Eucalyptus grandis]|uniref:uncharacterized protein LOC104414613 n=1 Tax=Eucalyptus grandis TaxID=71139 RepID=UPI00192ECBC9|nr:uncharacterized protein LOC104414613 [Eucalyptus grandis]